MFPQHFLREKFRLVIFVPEYVDMDTIDKSTYSSRFTFESVNPGTFDVSAQQEFRPRFIFLEKDHFLVYIRGGEPFKCNYQSRSRITSYFCTRCSWDRFNSVFEEVDGLRVAKQPHDIHYFVCTKESDVQGIVSVTKDNTIVEYFGGDDDLDLARFADIVKGKPNCIQKHFIVNKGDVYCAVETDNVGNTYTFTASRKNHIVGRLAAGTVTLDMFIEEDKRLEEMRANPERRPGFKLRGASGKIIADGETFALQILGDREGNNDDDDEDMEEMLSNLTKEERLRYGQDWVSVICYKNDDKDHLIGANVGYGAVFECETIGNIVYIKTDGKYLQCDSDNSSTNIYVSAKVPPKDKRVQIHYNNDGDICLTAWGGHIYIVCDWIKSEFAIIETCNDDEEQLRYKSPMRLRAIKL